MSAIAAATGIDDLSVHDGAMASTAWSKLVCFDGVGAGEVLVGGRKLVGLSQRRTRHAARLQCCWYSSYDASLLVELLDPYRTIADQRGYLPKNLPALKRVRALSGDQVCRFGRKVSISGKAVSVAQLHDNRSLKLPEWSGCRTLTPDELFLLTDHPKNYDGRYFGPVDRSAITGIAHPIWTD